MDEFLDQPPSDELIQQLRGSSREQVCDRLEGYREANADTQKELLRALQSIAVEQPAVLTPFVPELLPFLTAEERSVRLTTAKLFVSLSKTRPDAMVDTADALAARLADKSEFYYVRARLAETLGYVAVEYPEKATTPDLLADLRTGLSFDEPEVKEKLAKALAYVALGNPRRLCYWISDLAAHLDAEDELVRYYLSTAIVAVGCEQPAALSDSVGELGSRLDDECPYVCGRAAEALGLLAGATSDTSIVPEERLVTVGSASDEPFVTDRTRFALARLESESSVDSGDGIASLESIRDQVDEIADAIAAPDGECTQCGCSLPESGPPMCPRCGTPY
ncbi:HEAT repeat domain-containing protein [Natrialba taiwanensis]|uniref:HEAT domain containing protein n=1 Tax=Natrialba taiwanensis DSM 12281 TaxID=1230458 RepID=M0AC42_9EURY|nr:hypothetical protein [Natrialba taiwanensis]ELY96330.1 HEAT domain containing protein [Natrialba taiwanensis DSM 12281]